MNQFPSNTAPSTKGECFFFTRLLPQLIQNEMKSSSPCNARPTVTVITHTQWWRKDGIERGWRGRWQSRDFSRRHDQYFSILHSIRAAQKQFSVGSHSGWNKIFFSLSLQFWLHFLPQKGAVMKRLPLVPVIVCHKLLHQKCLRNYTNWVCVCIYTYLLSLKSDDMLWTFRSKSKLTSFDSSPLEQSSLVCLLTQFNLKSFKQVKSLLMRIPVGYQAFQVKTHIL